MGRAHSIHNGNLRHLDAGYLATGANRETYGFGPLSHESGSQRSHTGFFQHGAQGGRENFGRSCGFHVTDVVHEAEEGLQGGQHSRSMLSNLKTGGQDKQHSRRDIFYSLPSDGRQSM